MFAGRPLARSACVVSYPECCAPLKWNVSRSRGDEGRVEQKADHAGSIRNEPGGIGGYADISADYKLDAVAQPSLFRPPLDSCTSAALLLGVGVLRIPENVSIRPETRNARFITLAPVSTCL